MKNWFMAVEFIRVKRPNNIGPIMQSDEPLALSYVDQADTREELLAKRGTGCRTFGIIEMITPEDDR